MHHNEINYEPMNVFLNAGLHDSCIVSCQQRPDDEKKKKVNNHLHNHHRHHRLHRHQRSLLMTTATDSVKNTSHEADIPSDRQLYRILESQLSSSPINIELSQLWSENDDNDLSQCMRQYCPYTEPTLYNPEWTSSKQSLSNNSSSSQATIAKHPDIRLDFILVSQSVVQQVDRYNRFTRDNRYKVKFLQYLDAYVDISNATDVISDHYPVSVSWKYFSDDESSCMTPIQDHQRERTLFCSDFPLF